MNNLEYKQAKEKLGMKNPDIWCNYFRIARDTDKSYSSGRLPIPGNIELGVEELVVKTEEKFSKLKDIISDIFPDDSVEQCDKTNDISLYNQEYGVTVNFKNEGKDHHFHEVYSFIGPGKINHLILYYPEKPWVRDKSKIVYDWFYWRLEQSYKVSHHKTITSVLLRQLVLPNK